MAVLGPFRCFGSEAVGGFARETGFLPERCVDEQFRDLSFSEGGQLGSKIVH